MVLRAQKMLHAMVDAAPPEVDIRITRRWERWAPNLMTYGLGHPLRRHWTEAHKAQGGRLVGWDLGYWHRDVPVAFSMRCTLDDDHPHRWIRDEPGARWDGAAIDLREDADPDGPIVLVGLGRKQRAMMGLHGQEWETRTLVGLRGRYPGRRVVYRPKHPEGFPGLDVMEGPIESVLRGASLVACHHSNVAVDACIAGVPVECEDGAAFALYRGNPAPSRDQRLAFLRSLAWWQWTPLEARSAWDYLLGRIGG